MQPVNMRSQLLALGVGVVALALAAAALAVAVSRDDSNTTYPGPVMMSGDGPGMMMGAGSGMMGGNAPTRTQSSPGSLTDVRDWVGRWLDSRGFDGFQVGEVMAFTNNDYVLVRDARGKPAFELLTGPGQTWLMEEPPTMMWNARYGMMSGWAGAQAGAGMTGGMMGGGMMSGGWSGRYGARPRQDKPVSVAEAITIADRYLTEARPGEQAEREVQALPGYFTIDTTRRGKIAGMLSVNTATGAVWYHSWHGGFLGEREF